MLGMKIELCTLSVRAKFTFDSWVLGQQQHYNQGIGEKGDTNIWETLSWESKEETIHRIPLLIRAQAKTEHYIWILAKEPTASSSEEREHIEAEEKARGKETQDRPPQEKPQVKQ